LRTPTTYYEEKAHTSDQIKRGGKRCFSSRKIFLGGVLQNPVAEGSRLCTGGEKKIFFGGKTPPTRQPRLSRRIREDQGAICLRIRFKKKGETACKRGIEKAASGGNHENRRGGAQRDSEANRSKEK